MLQKIVIAAAGVLLLPRLALTQTPLVVEYYHLDAVGNLRAATDQGAQVIERHDYLPFGEEYNPQPGNQPLRFTGKERDTETGFDYFGARYYRASVGRFTAVDPLMEAPANVLNPQRWNRYAYTLNNPLRFKDPDGQSPTIVTGLIGAGIGGAAGFIGSIGAQFVRNDYSFSNINFRDAGAASLGGAVSGGLAGLTLGTSLVVEAGVGGIVLVGAGTNAVGGAVTRAADSSPHTRAGDVGEIGIDLATGTVGGLIGAKVNAMFSSQVPQLEATIAGGREAARLGGAGSFGASRSATGAARRLAATRTIAEVAGTVAGTKATNVVTPVGRELIEQDRESRP